MGISMADQDRDSLVQMGDAWIAIKRRWYLIVAGAVLGAVIGGAFASRSPSYQANATVDVAPFTLALEQANALPQVNIATEQEIALSGAVIGRVVNELDTDLTLGSFSEQASAASPPASETLVLSVRDSDPKVAAEYAEMWATEYLEFRREQAETAVAEAIARIDDTIELAQADFAEQVVAEVDAAPNSLEARNAASARRLAEEQLSGLIARRTALATSSTYPGQILSSPRVPTEPEGFQTISVALAGTFLGALMGLALAIFTGGPPRVVRSAQLLPSDLKSRVAADLAHPEESLNNAELAALVEGVRRLDGADVGGVHLVSLPGWPTRLSDQLSKQISARGIAVTQTKDPASPRLSLNPSGATAALFSCEQRNPWIPVLCPAADLVIIVAVKDRTTVEDARATYRAAAASSATPPGLVLMRAAGTTHRPAEPAAPPAVDREGDPDSAVRA